MKKKKQDVNLKDCLIEGQLIAFNIVSKIVEKLFKKSEKKSKNT